MCSVVICCVYAQVGQLSSELEETQTLAEERLKETEALTEQIVQLRTDLELAQDNNGEKSGSSSDVTTTATYLALQAQFSIVQQGGKWGLPWQLQCRL